MRKGFTLIEIVVVMGIIAILAVLLLKGVQSSRESGRMMSCSNNLRQLGIALNSYVDSVGAFPQTVNGQRGFSIHAMILPHIEQRNVYNSINFNIRYSDAANFTVSHLKISSFLCPSDYPVSDDAWNNYAACSGFGYQVYGQNGIFVGGSTSPTLTASIKDGLSNTAMMSEWGVGSTNRDVVDSLTSTYRTRSKLRGKDQYNAFIEECKNAIVTNNKKVHANKGSSWFHGSLSLTNYTHDMSINGPTCTNAGSVPEGAWTATSRHSCGCNVLFADGHVQFVKEQCAVATWRSIATISGGEMIDSSQL